MTGRSGAGPAAAALLLAAVALPAVAQPVDTTGVTACKIAGWSADRDPAGLNVRAAPRKDAPILAVLPPEADYSVEFDIIGSRDGWLLIRDAHMPSYGDAPDKPVFAGPGWVYADKVRFLINDAALRSLPKPDASVVLALHTPDFSQGPDSASIDHVYGCSGDFAEIEAHMSTGPHKRGWATHICSNQVTTCV